MYGFSWKERKLKEREENEEMYFGGDGDSEI
jgi:hypothetical protein